MIRKAERESPSTLGVCANGNFIASNRGAESFYRNDNQREEIIITKVCMIRNAGAFGFVNQAVREHTLRGGRMQ